MEIVGFPTAVLKTEVKIGMVVDQTSAGVTVVVISEEETEVVSEEASDTRGEMKEVEAEEEVW